MKRWGLILALALVALVLVASKNPYYTGALLERVPYVASYPLNQGTSTAYIHKFGDTAETTLADGYDVWDCPSIDSNIPDTYPYESAAFSLYVMSDDEADAAAVLTVEGLDADWDKVSVSVTLGADTGSGGTTATIVGTASNWQRVYRAYANTANLAGNVYFDPEATDATGNGIPDDLTDVQACITIGSNQTLMAIYTTADEEQAFIVKRCTSGIDTSPGTPGSATVAGFIRLSGGQFRIQDVEGLHANGTSAICIPSSMPFYVPPRTDIKARIIAADGLNRVSASFDIVEMKDTSN